MANARTERRQGGGRTREPDVAPSREYPVPSTSLLPPLSLNLSTLRCSPAQATPMRPRCASHQPPGRLRGAPTGLFVVHPVPQPPVSRSGE